MEGKCSSDLSGCGDFHRSLAALGFQERRIKNGKSKIEKNNIGSGE